MIGFTFNNKNSDEFGLVVRSDNRTMAPSKRRNQYLIPGRDGLLDYGNETFDNRVITVDIVTHKKTYEDYRLQVRDVAKWLVGSGNLIFDDEPNKAYVAKVYDSLDLEQFATTGKTSISFECLPYAESLVFNQVTTTFTNNNKQITANVSGTANTCGIITIRNQGSTTIQNITITRKVAI
jgi:predicted phage tail component-like protein